jgi:murein DD-endopeptidase MepM/ murein hydrolase activator NlpD
MFPTDDEVEGVGDTFTKEFVKAYKVLKQMTAETAKMKENGEAYGDAVSGGSTGRSKLGLGTVLGSFTRNEKILGGAAIAGGTFMSMAPNTMSAVAQRMYADSVAGLSGMKSREVITQSNRLVNGATSAGGPTQAAANLFYQGGYSASSVSSRNIMSQLGGLSAITGGTNEQTASSVAGINGALFLRLGVRIRDDKGALLPMNQIINSVYNMLYGGRTITEEQAALLLNPNSKGYSTLMLICGGDANLFSTIAMGVITRARKGKGLTKKDLGSAQSALSAMGVESGSPTRANFRFQSGQNAALQSTEGGLVAGYNTSLNVVGALNQGFADLASALGPVTGGLMGLKGILQTFPNAGNMGGTLATAGSVGMGMANTAMNAAIMGRIMGVGRFGAGATAGGGAKLLAGGLMGSGGLMSGLRGGAGFMGKGLGRLVPGLGALLSGMSGYGDQKSNKGLLSGLLAASGTGALAGGAAGAFAGGVGAIPGAILGALISGGGYLGGRALGSIGGPDDDHGIGGDNNMPGKGSVGTFSLPVPEGTKVTSNFGRRKGGNGISSNHRGMDFGVRENTNVTAAADGVVTEVGNGGGYGNYVIIKHGTKSTLYAHLNRAMVRVGQSVKNGQAIAKSGGRPGSPGAGASTGPHLHFEVRDNGGRGAQGRVDPKGFFGKAANFVTRAFKSGLNMAKKALSKITGGLFGKQDAFVNSQLGPSPTSLEGLSSASLTSLLAGTLESGREIGSEDLDKFTSGYSRRSVAISDGITGTLNSADDAISSQIPGGSRAAYMRMLRNAGFSGKSLETAFAVSLAESRGNPKAFNNKRRDLSYGLFQINMKDDDPKSPNMGRNRRKQFGIRNNEALYNPTTNIRAAYQVSDQGSWWKQWATYNDGTFLKYMDDAKRAKEAAGIGGGQESYSSGGMMSSGTATKEAHHKGEITVNMNVSIASASEADTERLFKEFSRKLKRAIEENEVRTY